MRLSIRHTTVYDYQPEAERCVLRLRLFASQFASQKRLAWTVCVNGEPVSPGLRTGFGDEEALWIRHQPMARVEIVASGDVETLDAAGFVREHAEAARPAIFLRSTALTAPEEAVRDLSVSVPAGDLLTRMHDLCAQVHRSITYKPGSTHAGTSAAEALRLGQGVCQDYAHAFIAAARLLGAPARYVVGYLAAGQDGHAHTHAWAEAFIADLGWVGFDPSVPLCPTDAYVRLASGLDSSDAAPIRGNVSGGVREEMSALVVIGQSQQ